MKKVVKFLLAVILLMPFCVDAREEIISGKILGNDDVFTSIFEVDDGYIVSGNSFWTDIDGVNALGDWDIRVFKFDKDTLDVKWQKIYGGSYSDYLNQMIKIDDGFVLVGYSESDDFAGLTNNGFYDAIIIKCNNNGEVIWKKSFGGSGDEYFFDVIETADNGFLAVGYSSSESISGLDNYYAGVLIKYDHDGNVVWKKIYNEEQYTFRGIKSTSDGYVIIGTVDLDGYDGVLLKVDLEGNILFEEIFGGSGADYFYSHVILDDGSIVVSGDFSSDDIVGLDKNGSIDAMILKYDKFGNLIWKKRYGGELSESFYKIKINNNELIVVGSSPSEEIDGIVNKGYEDALIVKYDLNGNLIEQKNYGGNSFDRFNDILFTNSGYVGIGYSASTNMTGISFDGGYPGYLIMKMDINYDLQKETDEVKNGTYELKQVGQRAEILLKPDNGYELDNIIVKDTNGNELTYYEENGKYYVDLTDDIVVDVKYKQKSIFNPNTGGLLMIGEIILLLIGLYGSFYFIKKKRNVM